MTKTEKLDGKYKRILIERFHGRIQSQISHSSYKDFIKTSLDIFFAFWPFFFCIFLLFALSILYQFSVNGLSFNAIFIKHTLKIAFSIVVIFFVASLDKKNFEAFAYPCYVISIFMLVVVHFFGSIKLGAQRWIDLYVISIQPSEIAKFTIIIALSRYYNQSSNISTVKLKEHMGAICILMLPVILIAQQPDLGTALLFLGIGASIIFTAGFPLKYIIMLATSVFIALPCIWFSLRTYQKSRIMTFLDPERDPLGTGYHILQSKIAAGSGGIYGKGYAAGSQSALNFLPEKNTDFIFTAILEEGGFFTAVLIIFLFIILVYYLIYMCFKAKNRFDKYVCLGVAIMIFLHAFINISMVIGLVPVVGIPIPFLSYGGSSLLTLSISLGLAISCVRKRIV